MTAVGVAGLLGAGGVAAATGGEGADAQPTGPQAAQAKQAALASVGAGRVTDVSTEGGDTSENSKASGPNQAGAAQSVWSVDVTKNDGSTVTVHLDRNFTVLGTTKSADGSGD